jgi:hypothetical protein
MEYLKLSPQILRAAEYQVKKFYKDNKLKYDEAYGFIMVKNNDGLYELYFGKQEESKEKVNFFKWLSSSTRRPHP